MKTTILIPCLDEEEAIGNCIDKANKLDAEVIVIDNGSRDNSLNIILEKKVKLVQEPNRGYGNAYLAGIKEATGENIIMVDGDGTYDLLAIPLFLKKLEDYDLVIGNRFSDMEKGAMPLLNRFANSILRLFLRSFKLNFKEVCTGIIGIKKDKLLDLDLKQTGFEFSTELLIKAKRAGLKMTEIPIHFSKRIGEPKLKVFRDGFRNFILLTKLKYLTE